MNWIFLATGIAIGFGLAMVCVALTAKLPPPKVSALEAANVLERIATGKVALSGVYPDEEGATVELETVDGWCVVLAFDDSRLFQVETALGPDDQYGEDWPDRNPLDILRERDPELVGLLAMKATQHA